MTSSETIATINRVRQCFLSTLEELRQVVSFRTLLESVPDLARSLDELDGVVESPHVQNPCTGELVCAFIGSSGHGKTTLMDEMFPALAERGWLETDVTDTTSQSLRIRYAAPGDPRLEEVLVHSWSGDQIKQLMNDKEVAQQNAQDEIRVSYLDHAVVVDGSDAALDPRDLAEWRFPRRVELVPLGRPYEVPSDKLGDRGFIRALTVKEQSAVLKSGSVLIQDGQSYDALQLRAVVKEVSLKDPFERIIRWANGEAEAACRLQFIDTPGLATSSVAKDEVLRHFLGRKSNQIACELLRRDELDIVVHIVLCGQKSQFEALWSAIERDWGQSEMDGIADRMILAINGMNIYFTNPDIRAKYQDPGTAEREGDHFAATLEDNVLQRMSPRGLVRPATICFVDSREIVNAFADYAEFYTRHRRTMEGWGEPGGVGYDTLARLGCVDTFRENIDALADPEDRGQGFLIRSILALAEAKGDALLLRKHLVRSGLLQGTGRLYELLTRYYDAEGRVNSETVYQAIARSLDFLDPADLGSIQDFARREIDPHLPGVFPERDAPSVSGGWLVECFHRAAELVKEAILDAHTERLPAAIWNEFCRYMDGQVEVWAERWGYRDADFPGPPDEAPGTRELLVFSLGLHCREMLYQLMAGEQTDPGSAFIEQSDADQETIARFLGELSAAKELGERACTKHGVRA